MPPHAIQHLIASLEQLPFNFFGQDFLLTSEKTTDELQTVMKLADILRSLFVQNISTRVFDSGLAIAQFRDKSTRTRFAFASAANLLGLSMQELDEEKSQISHGETVRETAHMISFLAETIGIRDDMFIGKGNSYMREVARALDAGVQDGVLDHRPTVINLQCDIDHPTQSLADLLHLVHHFGGDPKNLQGKKIAMTWAYSPSYGKPLSVPQGIITLMTRFGMNVSLAHPEGYDLLEPTLEQAKTFAAQSGGSFQVVHSMEESFQDADVVYPKSWAPFWVMSQRTELLEKREHQKISQLEAECLTNNARFKSWECNESLMKRTQRGEALYLHCLPADISKVSCEAGEVSAAVFEKYRVQTYLEARYKPYVVAALILLGRFRDPVSLVDSLHRQGTRRMGR